MTEKKKGLTGSTLKWIAILVMMLDHAGAGLIENQLLNVWENSVLGNVLSEEQWMYWLGIDGILRSIGRLAFPIFCFLLVEGFHYTSNRKRYVVQMLLFALISELPFDYALFGGVTWQYQNVFFTLGIAVLAIWGIDYGNQHQKPALCILSALAGCVAAGLLHTDYGTFGVFFVIILYLLRDRKLLQCIVGAVCVLWEVTAPLAFVLIWFYNGERGRQMKKFFYWFYPVHLALIWLLGQYVLPLIF